MFIGRFAPSPTGPLHMGSLIAALASYLDIRQKGGQWFVRIDDLDPPRQDPDAGAQILASLSAHGLVGAKTVDYQSSHQQRYQQAFEQIQQHFFYCSCTRRAIAGHAVYPGDCRQQTKPLPDTAVRVCVNAEIVIIDDGRQGRHRCELASERGDFIVKRRDGLWAYNFATAVDDGFDATHVLRGQDLFHVTAQQVYLMGLLGLEPPQYTHLPVLCFADGTKLSKQTHAPALCNDSSAENLRHAFTYLGLQPPDQMAWNVSQWLGWGQEHWHLERVPERLAPYVPKSL